MRNDYSKMRARCVRVHAECDFSSLRDARPIINSRWKIRRFEGGAETNFYGGRAFLAVVVCAKKGSEIGHIRMFQFVEINFTYEMLR